nr:hypothetical protein [Tanacetum cinerariifolium]
MFGVDDLDGDKVIMDVTTGENVEQSTKDAKKEVSTADLVTTASEVVTTAKNFKVTITVTTPQISKDELTLPHTLIEIKAAKPKARGVIVQEPSEFRTTSSSQPSQLPQAKDKEVTRKLEAQMKAKMEEEERIVRKKEKGNIVMIEKWYRVQAKTDADMELAQKLQTEEQEQLTNAEKARLFMKLLEKKRKFFERKRKIEKRNIPPTKAQQRNCICTYLKTWMEDGSPRKLDEQAEAKVDNDQREVEMKMYMKIIPDDEIEVDAIPLATKPPIIIDWKIIKEGNSSSYHHISADESSKSYSSMIQMLQHIDREDLETLWKLVESNEQSSVSQNYVSCDVVDQCPFLSGSALTKEVVAYEQKSDEAQAIKSNNEGLWYKFANLEASIKWWNGPCGATARNEQQGGMWLVLWLSLELKVLV